MDDASTALFVIWLLAGILVVLAIVSPWRSRSDLKWYAVLILLGLWLMLGTATMAFGGLADVFNSVTEFFVMLLSSPWAFVIGALLVLVPAAMVLVPAFRGEATGSARRVGGSTRARRTAD